MKAASDDVARRKRTTPWPENLRTAQGRARNAMWASSLRDTLAYRAAPDQYIPGQDWIMTQKMDGT